VKRACVGLMMLAAACGGPPAAAAPTIVGKTPVADYGPPPAGVPLLYAPDPRHDGRYVGLDWSGMPRGTIELHPSPDANRNLLQAPDGSAFLLLPFKGLGGEYFDRLGRPVAAVEPPIQFAMWADDSKHACTLGSAGGRWMLSLVAPDGTSISSRAVALDPAIARSGIIAIDFRSCAARNDRAVLVYAYSGRPTDVYVVRISDGTILLHQSHPADTLADITASPDGALVAESSNKSTGYLAGPTAPNTIVRRVADGPVVATLDPSFGVLAFSSDDSVALVNTSPWASGVATHLALVRLADSAVLWRYDGSEELFGHWVRPDGQDIAVLLQAPGPTLTRAPEDVVIVHPDGTATSERLR
jgi:hypothetical protein